MADFEHQRHKAPTVLSRPRELIVACAPMRSNVNFSQIVRTAGCCGVERLIGSGRVKVDRKVSRDYPENLAIKVHRTLPPALKKLKEEGCRLVGLEQTTNSQNLYEYRFERATVLVIGNERTGLTEEVLALLDDVVEIPVSGLPHSFNAAISAAMAMYEYCSQFPEG